MIGLLIKLTGILLAIASVLPKGSLNLFTVNRHYHYENGERHGNKDGEVPAGVL